MMSRSRAVKKSKNDYAEPMHKPCTTYAYEISALNLWIRHVFDSKTGMLVGLVVSADSDDTDSSISGLWI